jgi:hypothetical protein
MLKQHFQAVEGEHLRLDSSKASIQGLLDQARAYVTATAAR